LVAAMTRVLLLLLAAAACSTTTEPLPPVTLIVRNATCDVGPCTPLQILGFPDNQPLTPGGPWTIDLGVVTGPVGCITLPPSATFRVTNISTGATKTYDWTVRVPLALAAQPNPADRIRAQPTTGTFLPAAASGWSVQFPGNGAVATAPACSP
jgi:hypothetical protein